MSRRKTSRIWIDPQDFRDLHRQSGLTRREAAAALDVTGRTVQNWSAHPVDGSPHAAHPARLRPARFGLGWLDD